MALMGVAKALTTIVGLSGSLRTGSFNTKLLACAAAAAPPGATVRIETIRGIPLYDADVERAGMPPAVATLKDAVAAADGLLLVTPEYNNGIPGVFKNAIDWLSSPTPDLARVFGGKPVGLMGASPGGFGTILSQAAWLPVLRALGCQPWMNGRLLLSHAGRAFAADGTLVEEAQRAALARFMAGFVAFVQAHGRRA